MRSAKVRGLTASYKELPKSIALTGSFTSGNERALIWIRPRVEYMPSILSKITGVLIPGMFSSMDFSPKAVVPRLLSDLQVDIDDGASVITFDSSDCLPDEENYIEVTARIASRIPSILSTVS